MRQITDYTWHTGKLRKPVRLLVVADLHNDRYQDILPLIGEADLLLMPGDASDAYRRQYQRAIAFLREAVQMVPVFVGVGNHEMRLKDFHTYAQQVMDTGAAFLFNTYTRYHDLVIGGWYRPWKYGHEDMLPAFAAEAGCRVLLSHRPEDYFAYLQETDADLVLSGHTHGGQIRLGDRGLYASGQGLFPKHTKGVEGRMIISAGASNRVPVPRWNNPCEILRITLD